MERRRVTQRTVGNFEMGHLKRRIVLGKEARQTVHCEGEFMKLKRDIDDGRGTIWHL